MYIESVPPKFVITATMEVLMSQDRSWKSGKKIQWILCWYEDNGYVNWEVHDSRQSALLEGHTPMKTGVW